MFLDNCVITNVGKKVISSDYDVIIVLVEGTSNTVTNVDVDAAEANAINESGKITINGTGTLTINETKSSIKDDGFFYGLGGTLNVAAGTGIIVSGGTIVANGSSGLVEIPAAKKIIETNKWEIDVNIEDNTSIEFVVCFDLINRFCRNLLIIK